MEFENLKEEPLPADESDLSIPTRLAKGDAHRKFLESQIAALQESISQSLVEREELLQRAKTLRICEDANYKIVEVPIYPKKRVDVNALKRFPDKYQLILANISSRIKDKAEMESQKAESFISQSDVKAVIRDKATLAMVIPEVSEPSGWEISLVKK